MPLQRLEFYMCAVWYCAAVKVLLTRGDSELISVLRVDELFVSLVTLI